MTSTRHNSSTATPWEARDALSAPVEYEEDWVVAETQPEHRSYAQHQAPVDLTSRGTGQLLVQNRPQPRKKAAKVPSSFVERQEKLKVSKRKGPLQERQREKTHTMRKTKRICVRCRFYKSGVCKFVFNNTA
jgi:hypothetical protein